MIIYYTVQFMVRLWPRTKCKVPLQSSGSIGAGGSTIFDGYFELGRALVASQTPSAIYIPKPTVTVYI